MKTLYINFFIVLFAFTAFAQEAESLIENYEFYSDSSLETQYSFVQELLYVAGCVPSGIRLILIRSIRITNRLSSITNRIRSDCEEGKNNIVEFYKKLVTDTLKR